VDRRYARSIVLPGWASDVTKGLPLPSTVGVHEHGLFHTNWVGSAEKPRNASTAEWRTRMSPVVVAFLPPLLTRLGANQYTTQLHGCLWRHFLLHEELNPAIEERFVVAGPAPRVFRQELRWRLWCNHARAPTPHLSGTRPVMPAIGGSIVLFAGPLAGAPVPPHSRTALRSPVAISCSRNPPSTPGSGVDYWLPPRPGEAIGKGTTTVTGAFARSAVEPSAGSR